ncbi:MAG: hypothetical protein ACLTZY_13270 [Alistipes indistinctus]
MKKVAVGVDIGGTNSVYGLVDEAGEIISAKGVFPTRNYPGFRIYISRNSTSESRTCSNGPATKWSWWVSVSAPRTATTIPATIEIRTEPRRGRALLNMVEKMKRFFPTAAGHHHQRRECGSRR